MVLVCFCVSWSLQKRSYTWVKDCTSTFRLRRVRIFWIQRQILLDFFLVNLIVIHCPSLSDLTAFWLLGKIFQIIFIESQPRESSALMLSASRVLCAQPSCCFLGWLLVNFLTCGLVDDLLRYFELVIGCSFVCLRVFVGFCLFSHHLLMALGLCSLPFLQ